MSSEVLPSFPAIEIELLAEPTYETSIFESPFGQTEQRVTWAYVPRTRWVMRGTVRQGVAAPSPYQTRSEHAALLWFLDRHKGAGESFLFADPRQGPASDAGFGIGNGSTTGFQLQRSRTAPYTKRRRNMTAQSQNPADASWAKTAGGTGVAPVVTANAGVAPDGTVTAAKVRFDKGGGGTINDLTHLDSPATSPAFVTTCASPAMTGSVWMRVESGTALVALRLRSLWQLVTVTSTWQRFSIAYPEKTNDADSTPLSIWLRGTWGTDDAVTLQVWGAQTEWGATATDYIPTTTTALDRDPSYAPTLDDQLFLPSTPSPILGDVVVTVDGDGLGRRVLTRWQRTNSVLQSQTFDNASWQKGLSTVTLNTTVAPDGTTTGDTVTDNAVGGTHQVFQTLAIPKGSPVCFSVYAKEGTLKQLKMDLNGAGASAQFDVDAGTVLGVTSGYTASIVNCANGWFRCLIAGVLQSGSVTTVNLSLYDSVNSGTGTLILWGAQVEVGEMAAGDYLVTTTAAVSRTDYTLGLDGVVTMSVAPRAGAQLAWSGASYERVRFMEDKLPQRRVVEGWYAVDLELISVVGE